MNLTIFPKLSLSTYLSERILDIILKQIVCTYNNFLRKLTNFHNFNF